MSKLNFSSISDAFLIGSEQIKSQQDEISKLKSLISESALSNKKSDTPYQRIGKPDTVTATFVPPHNLPNQPNLSNGNLSETDFDYMFLKLIKHPQFEDIIKNYIIYKRPKWLLSETNYQPGLKETFGRMYSRTTCSDIKNYIIFFIVSVSIYLLLTVFLKK